MKTTNLFLISMAGLFLMTACSTDPQAKAKKSIEAYLKAHLNDPSSYEFVSIGNKQTFTLADEKKEEAQKKLTGAGYAFEEGKLPYMQRVLDSVGALPQAEGFSKLSLDEQKALAAKVVDNVVKHYEADSAAAFAGLQESLAKDSLVVKRYYYDVSFRAKNKLGALGLENHRFMLDPEFNVTHEHEITE